MRSGGPLSDLHRHLDGSLRVATVFELAQRFGVALPERMHFVAGMGLPAALDLFRFSVALLQQPEQVRRVAAEICEDAIAEGVTTLEVRFAPQLHRGAPAEEIVEAALAGLDGRAGLILCGLIGEPPTVLEGHVAFAATRPGVVGIDLAGGPTAAQKWQLTDYAAAYRAAAELGIGRTVHAGEGRPPAEIRAAVELLGAQRIGHGTTVLEDPAVTDLLIERGVVIEACPTSNVHTGVIPSVEAHPLPRWLARGLRACICSDNTLFSQTDAAQEHERAARIPGMGVQKLDRVIAAGHAAAFARG